MVKWNVQFVWILYTPGLPRKRQPLMTSQKSSFTKYIRSPSTWSACFPNAEGMLCSISSQYTSGTCRASERESSEKPKTCIKFSIRLINFEKQFMVNYEESATGISRAIIGLMYVWPLYTCLIGIHYGLKLKSSIFAKNQKACTLRAGLRIMLRNTVWFFLNLLFGGTEDFEKNFKFTSKRNSRINRK